MLQLNFESFVNPLLKVNLRKGQFIIEKYAFQDYLQQQIYKFYITIFNLSSNIQILASSNMQNQIPSPYVDHNSWLECIGQPQLRSDNSIGDEKVQIQKNPDVLISQLGPNDQQQYLSILSLHNGLDKQLFKRSRFDVLSEEQFFTSNSSECQLKYVPQFENQIQNQAKSGYKKERYAKQYIYSKNYRQKKKQQFKVLQQENQFLKKKIQDLQIRLRQKQLEINRLKHHSFEKQLTIQELNNQFLTKVTLFVQKFEKNSQSLDGHTPTVQKTHKFYDQILNTYDEHGFLGSRKKEILNYYFDQILEVSLRDSERYLCMLCCKNKNENLEKQIPQYNKINLAFSEIMQIDQEKQMRIKKYISFLHPAMRQIKKHCNQLYKTYKKILSSMDKVHQFMKSLYPQNMDFAKKRMKLQSWFQYHKYSKMMRKLKAEWLDFIKNDKDNEAQRKARQKQGKKKQKTEQNQKND